MNPPKIKVFGYRGGPQPSATERIEKELVNQGCELVEKDANLILEFTGLFDEAQNFWKDDGNKAVRLFNLLDVQNADPNFYNRAKLDYEECEIACTISNTAKNEIREKFQTNRGINVIGFPMRPVTYNKYHKGITFLYIGRFNDPNKRTYLIKPTLDILKLDTENHLIVAGSEEPPFGFYIPNPKDSELNDLYNSSEFTFLLSKKEGIGLTCCEATICGSLSLLANDSPVVKELGLQDFSSFPIPGAIVSLIKKMQKNPNYYWNKMDELRPVFQKQFSVETVVKNILDLYNNYISEQKT